MINQIDFLMGSIAGLSTIALAVVVAYYYGEPLLKIIGA